MVVGRRMVWTLDEMGRGMGFVSFFFLGCTKVMRRNKECAALTDIWVELIVGVGMSDVSGTGGAALRIDRTTSLRYP